MEPINKQSDVTQAMLRPGLKIEIQRSNCWVDSPAQSIRKGDVFKVLLPEGRYFRYGNSDQLVAMSDAYRFKKFGDGWWVDLPMVTYEVTYKNCYCAADAIATAVELLKEHIAQHKEDGDCDCRNCQRIKSLLREIGDGDIWDIVQRYFGVKASYNSE